MNVPFFYSNQYIALLFIKSYLQIFALVEEKHVFCKEKKNYQGLNFFTYFITYLSIVFYVQVFEMTSWCISCYLFSNLFLLQN